jgi:hypothetical protein
MYLYGSVIYRFAMLYRYLMNGFETYCSVTDHYQMNSYVTDHHVMNRYVTYRYVMYQYVTHRS